MMKSSALWILLACSFVCCQAQAQAQAPMPDVQHSFVLQHSPDGKWVECGGDVDCTRTPGQRGVWFDLGLTQQLVAEHTSYAEMQATLAASEKETSLVNDRLVLCFEKASLADKQAALSKQALSEATQRAVVAEATLRRWYNRRALWAGVGAAAVLVLEEGLRALLVR